MVSTCPFISKSFSPCTNPFVTVLWAPIKIGITVTFMFNSLSNLFSRSRYLSLFSFSFNCILWSAGTASSIYSFLFFVFVYYYNVCSSGRDSVICLYLKIPTKLIRFILLDRFWVVHIPFVRMVKFKFFAQLPVDHLAHPVLSRLILFRRKFAAFDFFVIDHFVFITTLSTSTVLLGLIYSCFDMIRHFDVVLRCYWKRFCFSL